jgi:NodT family efflux transporter outer membrane factor (OMF) lipoprotein
MGREGKFYPILLIIVPLLFGCAKVGPDFHRPDVMVSTNWMEAGDERVKNESADYRNWWRVFNDSVLDRLIDRAYQENLSIRIAGVRVLEARAQLGIALGGLYPQTQQASGSVQYNRPSAAGAFPLSEYYQSQIGANAGWELDFWGKFRRAIESADASWLATVADYDNSLVSLTADVANSYITIRTLEKRIEIAHQNVETQKESLKIAEARFKYGTVTQLDVEQARTVLESTLSAIPSLEAQLRQTENALSVLLGLPPSDLSDYLKGASEIPVSPPQVVVGIPADLLRRRPDVRSAEFQAAAQSAQIGVAKADLYPAFSLTGNFSFLATDIGKSKLGDIFKWSSRDIQTGPVFQWNIFNYGRITNNVRVQDARFQELLITYQNVVLKAQQEVGDNLIAFLRAQERARFLARSTASAKKALGLAVLQYRQGIKDFTTVLIAQQSLLNEQDNLATTLGNISSNLVGVYRALGGGWEIREGKELVPPGVREEMAKRTDWGGLLTPASNNPPLFDEPKSFRLPDR